MDFLYCFAETALPLRCYTEWKKRELYSNREVREGFFATPMRTCLRTEVGALYFYAHKKRCRCVFLQKRAEKLLRNSGNDLILRDIKMKWMLQNFTGPLRLQL